MLLRSMWNWFGGSVDSPFIENYSLKVDIMVTEVVDHVEGSGRSDVAVNLIVACS